MRRRWFRIVLIVLGALVLLIGGLLLALRLTSPSAPTTLTVPERKELPDAWGFAEESEPLEDPVPAMSKPPSATELESADRTAPFSTSGTLAFVRSGRPFGEESYELEITGNSMTLRSRGRFWFKVVVATISVTFEQTLTADGALRPASYSAVFDAPLGLGREVNALFEGEMATILSGDQEKRVRMPESTLVLGMFSTYALLPIVFPLRATDGAAVFEVLAFGGPPGQTEEGATSPMVLERLSAVSLRTGARTLSVDAYRVSSAFGDSLLLAKDQEFLGLLAGEEDESFTVYRSDFFPDGFDIVDSPAESPSPPRSAVP